MIAMDELLTLPCQLIQYEGSDTRTYFLPSCRRTWSSLHEQVRRHQRSALMNVSQRKHFNDLQMGVTTGCPLPFVYSEAETYWHEAAHTANSQTSKLEGALDVVPSDTCVQPLWSPGPLLKMCVFLNQCQMGSFFTSSPAWAIYRARGGRKSSYSMRAFHFYFLQQRRIHPPLPPT